MAVWHPPLSSDIHLISFVKYLSAVEFLSYGRYWINFHSSPLPLRRTVEEWSHPQFMWQGWGLILTEVKRGTLPLIPRVIVHCKTLTTHQACWNQGTRWHPSWHNPYWAGHKASASHNPKTAQMHTIIPKTTLVSPVINTTADSAANEYNLTFHFANMGQKQFKCLGFKNLPSFSSPKSSLQGSRPMPLLGQVPCFSTQHSVLGLQVSLFLL